jgi:hypothetical protein
MKRHLYTIAILAGLLSISACTKSDLGLDEGSSYESNEPLDYSCSSVASKILDSFTYTLGNDLAGRIGAEKVTPAMRAAVAAVRDQRRPAMTTACTSESWPEAARQCAMRATTSGAVFECLPSFGDAIAVSVRERLLAANAAMEAALDQAVRQAPATFSLALFKHGLLHKCADASVSVTVPVGHELVMTTEQLAYLFADDAIMAMTGGESASVKSRGELASMVAKFVQTNATTLDAATRASIADMVRGLSWPPPTNTDQGRRAAAGELIKVGRCAETTRFVFGTCTVAETTAQLAYRVTWEHYDLGSTVDSDKGFTLCSRVGGQWTAPPREDIEDQRMERMIQEHRARRN